MKKVKSKKEKELTQMAKIDPATLEIVRGAFIACSNEMGTVLSRTAYNPMVFEVQDFCIGIIDPFDVRPEKPGEDDMPPGRAELGIPGGNGRGQKLQAGFGHL